MHPYAIANVLSVEHIPLWDVQVYFALVGMIQPILTHPTGSPLAHETLHWRE